MSAPVVVAVTGLPGTGKSTLADLVAQELGVPAFAGDWLLGSLEPAARVLVQLSGDEQRALYDSMLRSLVHRQLLLGHSCVVDGLVTDAVIGDWTDLGRAFGAHVVVVECVCSDVHVHRSRVEGRVRNIPGWHEIDWAHVERMRAALVPLTVERLVVDAVDPVAHNLGAVLRALTTDA